MDSGLPPTDAGTLLQIRRYPVKSMRGERLPRSELVEDGACAGVLRRRPDHHRTGRRDAPRGCTRSPRRAQPLGRTAGASDPRWGVSHFDEGAVSIVTTAALGTLSRAMGHDVDPRRFGANLLIDVVGDASD